MGREKKTQITSFCTTDKMVKAIKDVAEELGLSQSGLIRRAVEDYFLREGLYPKEKQSTEKDQEDGHELL